MNMLTGTLGPAGPLIAVGGLGLVLVLATLPFLLGKGPDPMQKLKERTRDERRRQDGDVQSLRLGGRNKDKLEKFSTFLEPQNAEEFSAVKLRLLQAGYRSPNAIRMFHFAQFALGIGALVIGLFLALSRAQNGEVTTQSMILWTLIPGAVGYMLPRYWVTKRLQKRREEITNGFPDSLDMMLVCVEAGQSMDHSIARVATEIRSGYPALADEYQIVAYEVKAGKDKPTVLKDMAERAGVPDVANFVTVLIQSAAFGTSIAEALRVYASEMRDKRVMRAEEKANTLPTKMTLATMMFCVPPLLIILLGPSIHSIIETFGQIGM
ncbi:type II secretion system F family protein [Palleronia sediminis]